jgi:hypothetical protein
MKKTTKPAAKAAAKPATKRPRTYKKADLPRTARAYLGKVYEVHMGKENEAVARLIEMHEERTKALLVVREELYKKVQAEREADFAPTVTISGDYTKFNEENLEAILKDLQPKQLTLREKFLAWIGAR